MEASSRASQACCRMSVGAPSGWFLLSAFGVLDLPVGELVRPGFPVGGDAESPLVCFGQGGERGVDAGEARGPAVGQGEHHAGQERAGGQLPGPDAGGEQCLDERGDAGGVGDVLDDRQRHVHRGYRARPPSRVIASAWLPASSPAVMSPSCW